MFTYVKYDDCTSRLYVDYHFKSNSLLNSPYARVLRLILYIKNTSLR